MNYIWQAIYTGSSSGGSGSGSGSGNSNTWNSSQWAVLAGEDNSIVKYEPGVAEFTNLGLLYTRAYLTLDGSTGIQHAKASLEKSWWVDNTPSIDTLRNYREVPFIMLPCMNKMVPGIEDSPTWTLMTDSPYEFIGRTYSGKPERLSTLEFTCPAQIDLQQELTKHCEYRSMFTLIQCYDDPNQENIYYIVTPRCQAQGAGTSSSENNSGGELSVKFQPIGGMFVPVYLSQARS